ncbi:MAG: carboxypeptidase-like regulatory domain-containing protein, partial [Muribaculaceae bacterium]|nr:carboxypeptidase-like regulatory domain-containing protein [Muribaculaceae bacterium]
MSRIYTDISRRTASLLTLLLLAAASMVTSAASVSTTIPGLVRDSLSNSPVPFAAIYVVGTDGGVLADDNGRFAITARKWPATLRVSVMGYSAKTVIVTPSDAPNIVIDLIPEGIILNEIRVKRQKEHYSKKNNPAVELMRRIAASGDMTDPRRNAHYNYDKYERITIALNDFQATDSTKGNAVSRQFSFASEYTDTSDISGKPILPLSVKEKTSHIHYRHNPEAEREVVTAIRRSGIDEITDQEIMQTLFE